MITKKYYHIVRDMNSYNLKTRSDENNRETNLTIINLDF